MNTFQDFDKFVNNYPVLRTGYKHWFFITSYENLEKLRDPNTLAYFDYMCFTLETNGVDANIVGFIINPLRRTQITIQSLLPYCNIYLKRNDVKCPLCVSYLRGYYSGKSPTQYFFESDPNYDLKPKYALVRKDTSPRYKPPSISTSATLLPYDGLPPPSPARVVYIPSISTQ